jgi:flagellar basal-body rod protein FlgG
MWTTLRVAASGMQAHQRALDTAGNNLANVQTPGFKVERAAIVDLPPARAIHEAHGGALEERPLGQGVQVAASLPNQAQGALLPTGHPLDVAIDGDGYFRVTLANGQEAYTRVGALRLDREGRLATPAGAVLQPSIGIPDGASHVRVESDGSVVAQAGSPDERVVGRLELARFPNPDGLQAIGGSLLLATETSGVAQTGAPGSAGFGRLVGGSLEGSNADLGQEVARVLQAQRAYSVSARALKTVDEMMQEANNLRR